MDQTTPGALQRVSRDERGIDLFFERGRMRLSPVFEGAVRVRFTPEEAFLPRRSWDVVPPKEEWEPVPFNVEEGEDAVALDAAPLRVTVSRADGRVAFADEDGREFGSDVSPVAWAEVGMAALSRELQEGLAEAVSSLEEAEAEPHRRALMEIRVRKRMAEGEVYAGFGQRIGLLDRRGRQLTNWTVDPESGHNRGSDNLYQAHPTFLAVRPGLAWGMFLHSTWLSRFDAGAHRWDELGVATQGGELDYYLFHGPDPAGVVEKLTRLTGRPALPPLWAMGYHQSRWGYRTEADVREIARGFRERDIPLDAIHFDIDYMRGYRDFTWDPERFPDPAGLLRELREQGIRAVTIIDPGVKEDLGGGYAVADDGMARGVFITNPDGTPYVGFCWPDAALFPDFARAEVRAWWGEQHRGFVEAGVAGIWNDMNEPATFDRPFSEGFSEQKPIPLATPQGAGEERTIHAEAHNVYGLLMGRATYEGLLALRPDSRPWILTRSGYTGVQRYAAAWMGDNSSWWEHLEGSLPQLTSMGLGGVPHVGVDIGGFFENPSAELYARWIELGPFYPFMRTHTIAGTNRQEPWSFGPEVEAIARDAIRLRYRLLPYLYTLAHEASRTGAPLLRPLLYDFPDDPDGYHLHDQVMVGPHLMVAPVYHPGRTYRMVYLPEGRWFDFRSGETHEGGRSLAVHAPRGRIPVFVRAGAVLPLGNARSSTNEPLTELTLAVYPGGESSWTLVEDDGETFAYQRGELAETPVRVSEAGGSVSVTVGARRGGYLPAPRTLSVHVHTDARPAAVTLDGRNRNDWTWDEERGAASLGWPDDGQAHVVEVRTDR